MSSEQERRSWRMSTRTCDSCKTGFAQLFCRADSAFLCLDCDSKVHNANMLASRHERVWICEVCEQAPASVTCKADAAALCVTCDEDIHSANPLARRHERVPIAPFNESSVKSHSLSQLVPDDEDDDEDRKFLNGGNDSSWLLPNLNTNQKPIDDVNDLKATDFFFSDDVDPYLDFNYSSAAADSVVPAVRSKAFSTPILASDNYFEFDFGRSKPSYSISSSDVGVVPDGNSNSMTDTSNPFSCKTGGEISSNMATEAVAPQPLSSQDREARVLRYREKRKNRKFEKTIRYASRKAYAETRPRFKGRFVKRTEIEHGMDQMYASAANLIDSSFGVVPTF